MRHSKIHIFLLTFVLFVGLSSSCEKQQQHPVPSAYANFSINLQTDPEFIRLAVPGNSMVINNYTVGASTLGFDNNGVIVYNAGDGEFYVYDRTCPYDMPKSIAVESDGQVFAKCPECGTEYVLSSFGNPTIDGPGIWALKEYKAYYNVNTDVLQVYN
jgi:hypothetical protein